MAPTARGPVQVSPVTKAPGPAPAPRRRRPSPCRGRALCPWAHRALWAGLLQALLPWLALLAPLRSARQRVLLSWEGVRR